MVVNDDTTTQRRHDTATQPHGGAMATSDDKMKWSDGSEKRRQDIAMETIFDSGNDGEMAMKLFF